MLDNKQQQQMESRIGSIGQREMIARLLHDSDFADPVFVDPAEYSNNSNVRGLISVAFKYCLFKKKIIAAVAVHNVKIQLIQIQQHLLMMNAFSQLLKLLKLIKRHHQKMFVSFLLTFYF